MFLVLNTIHPKLIQINVDDSNKCFYFKYYVYYKFSFVFEILKNCLSTIIFLKDDLRRF